jgi:multidrug efflux system membrane fusion protein
MSRLWRVVLAVGGVLGAFILYEVVTSFVAYTSDAYVRSDLVAVAPQVTGRIVAVHVTDNQTVKRGDKLVSIDPVPFQLVIAQRAADIDAARAQADADRDAIAAAQDRLQSAQSALGFAQSTQDRVAALVRTSDVSRQDLDAANDSAQRAQAALAAAAAGVAESTMTHAMHVATLARAEAEMATAKWRLSRTDVLAPTDGTVNNLTVRAGDTAVADTPLIGIVDAHAWRIIANYKQSYLRGFQEGGTAWVWLDSAPWHFRRARIGGIARGISREESDSKLLPYVAPSTDWIRLQRRFPVTIFLDGPPPGNELFMGADARVVIFP